MGTGRRVLHVVGSLNDHDGGLPSAVVSIANAQASAGHSVTLASTGPDDAHAGLDALSADVRLQLFPRSPVIRRFNGSLSLHRWVRANASRFDVLHVHSVWTLPSYATAVRALCSRRGLVVSPHGSLEPFDVLKHARAKQVLGRILLRPVLSRCAAVHCTAQREADTMVTYGASIRPFVVTLPVVTQAPPPDARARLRTDLGVPPEERILLFLGRIDYKKGLSHLLGALARFREPRPLLVVAGRGTAEYEAHVRRLADELQVADRVRFVGWLSGLDKLVALGGADLFVLLSDNENYGISAMEATMAGLPAVLSDEVFIGPDLVAAGASVVAERDPVLAAEVLAGLLGDADRLARMRAAAASFAVRLGERSVVTERYGELAELASRDQRATANDG